MAIELATAYVSLVAETTKLEKGVQDALNGVGRTADVAGKDMGTRLAKTASKALKDGWRPDQDIMAGIPNTKLDRIGARIGQVIGKGISSGIKAQQLGRDFGSSFAAGAGSIGLGSVISGWRNDLRDQPNKLGFLAGKGISAGLQLGLAGVTAIIGTALKTGFDRLVALDTAQNKLRAVLRTSGDPADFDRINKAVQKAVDQTPFSLDQAFGTAVQAVGAGVKDIERFMQTVSDAAGFAGTDLERMGLIFNQVLAKGKLTGEETMQLMEAGIPARSWIQDSYDLTAEQFDDMQQKGQISLDMLIKAVEQKAPGMAKALGNTLQGSIDNMQTALARTGANFLAAVFGGPTGDPTESLKSSVQRVTQMLNNLNTWIVANKDSIKNFFDGAKDAVGNLVTALGNVTTYLSEHKGLIEGVFQAFIAWNGLKFLGLLGALTNVSNALGAKGGGGLLGKLGVVIAAIEIIDRFTGKQTGPVNAGPDFAGQGSLAIGGALIGGQLAGPAGAAAGGLIGAAAAPAIDIAQGANPAQNGVLPGAPGTYGGSTPTVGGIPIPGLGAGVGTAGRGWMNSAKTSAAIGAGSAKGGPESWRPAVRAALAQYGPGLGVTNFKAWEDALVRQIATESGGNPAAHNPNDTDGRGGRQTVSGLLQFLPSTFAAHNITGGAYTDPMAQIPAAIDYVMKKYGVDANGAPLQIGRGVGYDTGGWLPPGSTNVVNNTGQPELILNPEQIEELKNQGLDPNTLLHGTTNGAQPGPAANFDTSNRTGGFVPVAAGNTGVAGTSFVSGLLNLGNEAVSGAIDAGAQLAQMAASAAIAGGTMGAGAAASPAAGPAASAGIQILANVAKRASAFGFQLAGIGADSLIAQLFPFGAPRWLGYDYTAFTPQMTMGDFGVTTGEKAANQAQGQGVVPGQDAGGPVQPSTMPGAAQSITPHMGSQALPGPAPMSIAPPNPNDDLLSRIMGYDQGGMLPPGGLGINMTNRPEPVLTPQQWDSINRVGAAEGRGPLVKIDTIYGMSPEDVASQIESKQKLAMMRYAGRP